MKSLAHLVLVMLLAACSSQVTEPSYYLLRGDVPLDSRPLKPNTEHGLGLVELAPYIDQQGLLLEVADGEIRPARNHRWAEPVYEGVRIFLLQEISRASGRDLLPLPPSGVTLINVRIDQLHGTRNGEAVLVAYWWTSRQGEVLAGYQFAEREPLASDGYPALAAAQKSLLSQLARNIADNM